MDLSKARRQKAESRRYIFFRRFSMSSSEIDRRRFLEKAAGTAAAFTILPRHVLGGPQFVAPSDKVTLAYIGLGTQGNRELMELLPSNDIRVVASAIRTRTATITLTGRRTGCATASESSSTSPTGARAWTASPAAAKWAARSSRRTMRARVPRAITKAAHLTPTFESYWRSRRMWTA